MSEKDWGDEQPGLSGFVRTVPRNAKQLLAKLNLLKENWKHVDKCGVVREHKAFLVDLWWVPTTQLPDFYIPLKEAEVDSADAQVRALIAKVEQNQQILLGEAEKLFAMIDAETAAAVAK